MLKTFSISATNSALLRGEIPHSFFCQGLSSFFLESAGWSHVIFCLHIEAQPPGRQAVAMTSAHALPGLCCMPMLLSTLQNLHHTSSLLMALAFVPVPPQALLPRIVSLYYLCCMAKYAASRQYPVPIVLSFENPPDQPLIMPARPELLSLLVSRCVIFHEVRCVLPGLK